MLCAKPYPAHKRPVDDAGGGELGGLLICPDRPGGRVVPRAVDRDLVLVAARRHVHGAVRAGDQIGKEGMTGAATGCHLHYSLIRMDGEWQDVLPRLNKYGYPLLIREHVDPLDVLPWGDQYAPKRLRDQIYPPSPTPTPASPPPPTTSPSPTPTGSPGTTPTASPSAHPG